MLALTFAVGLLVLGVTDASASTYCAFDPTVNAGVPLASYSGYVNVNGTNVYVEGTSSSTTFGGGVLVP